MPRIRENDNGCRSLPQLKYVRLIIIVLHEATTTKTETNPAIHKPITHIHVPSTIGYSIISSLIYCLVPRIRYTAAVSRGVCQPCSLCGNHFFMRTFSGHQRGKLTIEKERFQQQSAILLRNWGRYNITRRPTYKARSRTQHDPIRCPYIWPISDASHRWLKTPNVPTQPLFWTFSRSPNALF